MWEQRCQELVKDASKLRTVVVLGHLIELLNVGKSEFNPTGLGLFLRPAIARGELLAIAECTPEQIATIEKEDPQMLDAFRQNFDPRTLLVHYNCFSVVDEFIPEDDAIHILQKNDRYSAKPCPLSSKTSLRLQDPSPR